MVSAESDRVNLTTQKTNTQRVSRIMVYNKKGIFG
jgi:hypothetical protein